MQLCTNLLSSAFLKYYIYELCICVVKNPIKAFVKERQTLEGDLINLS